MADSRAAPLGDNVIGDGVVQFLHDAFDVGVGGLALRGEDDLHPVFRIFFRDAGPYWTSIPVHSYVLARIMEARQKKFIL